MNCREIQEIYTGFLPPLRVQSECRCPPSHPRVRPDKTHYCIPNNVVDNSGNILLRLNDEAHFLEFINDGDSNSIWISKFQNEVEITVDLGDVFQVCICKDAKLMRRCWNDEYNSLQWNLSIHYSEIFLIQSESQAIHYAVWIIFDQFLHITSDYLLCPYTHV